MTPDDTTIRRSWDSWVQKPVFPERSALFQGSTLLTRGSPRFNMYGNDFGSGKPMVVRSGIANKSYGKIYVIPWFHLFKAISGQHSNCMIEKEYTDAGLEVHPSINLCVSSLSNNLAQTDKMHAREWWC
ncbi:hypothetical protein MKW98_016755 [Papaver atlanticum]|uniref:Uncharacterized protein n=1 Tax=Papaver atlanticum TaxID=357466 RepID=A0AAD4TLC7_9MAGN|nr:hypothetical protein MKW98_016755 [Papaver atlanticum]